MTTVHVTASREYDVLIGRGLLDELGGIVRRTTKAQTAVVVAGDIVFPLCGARAVASLERAGLRTLSCVIPHGERYKTLETYGKLLQFLSENRLTRTDVLIALGGGVTGDLTGFAAATYQRGMNYVQVPTTLLAAVDSSVGGKTAVDLPTGKNQVGAFYQPAAVLCDPDLMDTLPEAEFRCGTAEVIKYGMLGSAAFFESLEEHGVKAQLEDVIRTCVEMKRDIVHEDEFDRGQRQLLNLGHSFGHAVEACSRFGILHGQAVAIGMAIITRAAVRRGDCPEAALERLLALLKRCGLPTETDYSADALFAALGTDKKLSGSTMHLVIPEDIGRCRIEAMPLSDARELLRLGGVQ